MIPDPLGDAVSWLRGGGLLAYPTETVWGLGADATSDAAVARLLRWKAREPGDPLAILIESGSSGSRPFQRCRRATAASEVASAPSPQTVSVG